jgi:phospholipase C
MSPRRAPTAALIVVLSLVLAACGGGRPGTTARHGPSATSSAPTTAATGTPGGNEGVPGLSHIFVVVMENLGVQAASATPAFARLAQQYQSTTHWYAVSHPSLPNYLALASGSTWGVDSDCTDCNQSGPNLASQLQGAGISWGAYFEGMPAPCFLGPQSPDGSYAKKHDPFAYFADVRGSSPTCSHLQPLSTLSPLLAGPASAVPRFVWVTPNLCHDGHDCSPTDAGSWLASFVSEVTASSAYKSGGMLVVAWDEAEGGDDGGMDTMNGAVTSSGGGGRVLALVMLPGAPAGRVLSGPYDHYSLLRTIEDSFGLPRLGHAADGGVRPLTAFFSSGH